METPDLLVAKRNATKEWRAWKDRTAKGIPELAARVFALRGKPYLGSGSHYEMEKLLGRVIVIASDKTAPFDFAGSVIDEVLVEELYRDVALAEASLLAASEK